MAAAREDLLIEQGATFRKRYVWYDSQDMPIDLTGYTARMHIREKIEDDLILEELTTENGRIVLNADIGSVDLQISATDTSAIDWKRGYYDIEIENGSIVTRLVQGRVEVSEEVTR
ncbi:MAG: hypothetical protein GY861_22625 [bacterium]|nr:hypothetical protein [bacterium]